MTETQDVENLRPEIAMSWHRATLTGLDPGMSVREGVIGDVDRRSRLAVAAAPVLDRMMVELFDTKFSVLLADRTATIVDRRLGQRASNTALDRVLAVPGSRYLEELSGTNSLATAFELQRPIAVTGGEHFLEALKVFCCFGAPIVHPVTRRVEGVLDISGPSEESTALLGPFLMRAVGDIQIELLHGSRLAEQRLLAAYQQHTRSRLHAVLVFGENLVLANPSAADVVRSSDHATLRGIAAEIVGDRTIERRLKLASGSHVVVSGRAVADCPGGVIFEIVPAPQKLPASARGSESHAQDVPTVSVALVTGEPGTGRTARGRALTGPDAIVFDATEIDGDDDAWLGRILQVLRSRDRILIDNIHVMSARLSARLAPAIRRSQATVVLTSSPLHELDCEQSGLAAIAIDRHELRPVRLYQDDFSDLVLSVLGSLPTGAGLGITASALQILAAQAWPGNIRELRSVLEWAVRGRSIGDITESDLPSSFRSGPTRRLTGMETAEREAIQSALRACDGNRVAAAVKLGIGRTTLYDRIRRYGITA
jgi:sigma-54 dependent transcriptional regulator, acetoin dehydrogenase operon transcriptional activator AcoR